MGLGLLFAAIGIVGIWIPLIPTTGPILLAAFLFSKSSARFDRWLVDHRVFGPIIRDWRSGRGFTVRLKAAAVIAIALSFAITLGFALDNPMARLLLGLFGAGLIVYILRLPTKPEAGSAA
jgi:hypothetical protein